MTPALLFKWAAKPIYGINHKLVDISDLQFEQLTGVVGEQQLAHYGIRVTLILIFTLPSCVSNEHVKVSVIFHEQFVIVA